MTYAQLITYISTWIYENHNNEITANTLKDVLEKLAQYARDNDQEVNDEIQNLWDAINNIVISDGVEAHQGDADPNVTPPANYNTGDLYVQDLDKIWIYNGIEWVLINSGNVNISLKKIDIPIDYTEIPQLLEYFNTQNPPLQKDRNENWIIQTSDGSQFFLVGVGAGRIGENYINLTEENILQISSGSGGNTHPTKTLTTTTKSLTITTDYNYYVVDAENDELEITLDLDLESDENFRAKVLIKNATGFEILSEGLRETNLSSLFDSEFDNLITIDWFGEEGVWKCELVEENSMIYRKETHHGGFSYAAKPEAVGGQFYEFEGKMFYVVTDKQELKTLTSLWNEEGLSPDTKKEITGANGVYEITANQLVVTRVTNMSELLSGSEFNQFIENWDVSNVTTMLGLFFESEFNQDIGNWDVSRVTSFLALFRNSPFNQDIGNWDTIEATDMSHMFQSTPFNQDIGSWKTGKVTNMRYMFNGTPFNQDIGSWDVSKVENTGTMFQSTPFDQDIGNWDVQNVKDMQYMFRNCPFNQDIGNWNVGQATNMIRVFQNNLEFNQDISNWCVEQISGKPNQFDANTNPAWTEEMKPKWGEPCN